MPKFTAKEYVEARDGIINQLKDYEDKGLVLQKKLILSETSPDPEITSVWMDNSKIGNIKTTGLATSKMLYTPNAAGGYFLGGYVLTQDFGYNVYAVGTNLTANPGSSGVTAPDLAYTTYSFGHEAEYHDGIGETLSLGYSLGAQGLAFLETEAFLNPTIVYQVSAQGQALEYLEGTAPYSMVYNPASRGFKMQWLDGISSTEMGYAPAARGFALQYSNRSATSNIGYINAARGQGLQYSDAVSSYSLGYTVSSKGVALQYSNGITSSSFPYTQTSTGVALLDLEGTTPTQALLYTITGEGVAVQFSNGTIGTQTLPYTVTAEGIGFDTVYALFPVATNLDRNFTASVDVDYIPNTYEVFITPSATGLASFTASADIVIPEELVTMVWNLDGTKTEATVETTCSVYADLGNVKEEPNYSVEWEVVGSQYEVILPNLPKFDPTTPPEEIGPCTLADGWSAPISTKTVCAYFVDRWICEDQTCVRNNNPVYYECIVE